MKTNLSVIIARLSYLKYLTLVLVLLMVSSCGFFHSPDRERCQKILPREQLTNILADIYLMEGYLSDHLTRHPEYSDSVDYYYAGIFHKHGVSRLEFKQALDCYLLFEVEMEQIHEEILKRLSLKMSEAEAELQRFIRRQEEELLLADSLATDSLATDFISPDSLSVEWFPTPKPPLFFIKNTQGRIKDSQGRR